jgi:hypothetical protein
MRRREIITLIGGTAPVLNGEHSLASFLSKKWSPRILGLLQQNLPQTDIVAVINRN